MKSIRSSSKQQLNPGTCLQLETFNYQCSPLMHQSPHGEHEGFCMGLPATVAADGRRVVAPALRPAPGAAGSTEAGVKAATGPEAPLEGQERSRPPLSCGARVLEGASPLGSGSGLGSGGCDTVGLASAHNSQPVSQHTLERMTPAYGPGSPLDAQEWIEQCCLAISSLSEVGRKIWTRPRAVCSGPACIIKLYVWPLDLTKCMTHAAVSSGDACFL